MHSGIERRRTIRIRRSALIQSKLDELDRPAIKIAETLEEYMQSFSLVYTEYLKEGYVTPHQSEMYYNIYSLLPKTAVFVFKTYLKVVATMSVVEDTPMFGIPMDSLYKQELDKLRAEGRKLVEVSSLATMRIRRWSNLMVFLSRAAFRYVRYGNATDIVAMVNPKHVRFYTDIFLFEPIGETKFYSSVNAEAVALRLNLDGIEERMEQIYGDQDFDTDLFSFFMHINSPELETEPAGEQTTQKHTPMDTVAANMLLRKRSEIMDSLTEEQRRYICSVYPKALFPSVYYGDSEYHGNA